MRLVRFIFLTAIALTLATGCRRGVKGSGTRKTEERSVPAFSAMSVSGAFEVAVAIGPERNVSISADDNVLPFIRVEVKDDKLEVSTTQAFDTAQSPSVSVKTPRLDAFSTSGAAKVTIEGVRGEAFRISTSGASDLTARGKVDRLTIDASGAGRIALGDLSALDVDVHMSGGGDMDLFATATVKGTASGAGKILCGGGAKVSIETSGAVQIVKR